VTPRPRMIGYNRTVKLRWLDETLDLLLGGESEAAISDTLRQRLGDQLSVGSLAVRGSREKTITLLLKTWVRVPNRIEVFVMTPSESWGMFVALNAFLSTGG